MATWVCGCSTWTIRKLFISGSCGTCRAVCEFPRQRTPGVARGLVNHKLFYSIRIPPPYPARKTRERKRERGHSGLLFSPLLFFFFFPTPPAAGGSAGVNERLLVFVPVSRYVWLCNGIQHVRRTDEPQPNATKRNETQREATVPNPHSSPPSPPRL